MIIFLDKNRLLPRVKSDLSNLLMQYANKYRQGLYDNPFINIHDLSESSFLYFMEPIFSNGLCSMKLGIINSDSLKPTEFFTWKDGSTEYCSYYDYTKCNKKYKNLFFNDISITKVEGEINQLCDSVHTITVYDFHEYKYNVKRTNTLITWRITCLYQKEEFVITSQDNINRIKEKSHRFNYESYPTPNTKDVYKDLQNHHVYDYGSARTFWELKEITRQLSKIFKIVEISEVDLSSFGFSVINNTQIPNKRGFENENDFIYSIINMKSEPTDEGCIFHFTDELKKNLTPYYVYAINTILDTDIKYSNNIDSFTLNKNNKNYNIEPKKIIGFLILNICQLLKIQNNKCLEAEKQEYYSDIKPLKYEECLYLSNDLTSEKFANITSFKKPIHNEKFINRIIDLLNIRASSKKDVLYRTGDHEDEITYEQKVEIELNNDASELVVEVYKYILGEKTTLSDNTIVYEAHQFEKTDRSSTGYDKDYSEYYKKDIIIKATRAFFNLI